MVAIKNYEVWNHPVELIPEKEAAKKSEIKTEAPPMMAALKEPMPIGSYILISEKNIFSPGRKDFPITPLEQTKTNVHPQVILYGVTIAGDFQAASLVNPGRPLKKGERETMTVKIGEKIGEYKLAKIQPDRITMESNGDSFEVLLYDSRNPKKRMEVNKKKEGVKTLPSGLQYKVLMEGSGKTPKAANEVTVNYRGIFIDGTEFDSTYKRGKPGTFQVDRVIRGWTEALQLMKEGSKWQLFILPDLGYGDRGAGPIPPNGALIFEVELISVK